jgi:hypothetical protein
VRGYCLRTEYEALFTNGVQRTVQGWSTEHCSQVDVLFLEYCSRGIVHGILIKSYGYGC